MDDVVGKACVVTGASSGIGRRTALDLAAAGARVCAVARRRRELEGLVEELGGEARGHCLVVADVSDRAAVEAVAGEVGGRYGRCDVLVNNAGFSRGGAFSGPESVDDVAAMMATNFLGTVYCTAALFGLLAASAPASVVNVASMAGRIGLPGASGYSASKFAVVGWSEALYYELRPRGIHVGVVLPGPIPTEGFPQSGLVESPFLRHALGSDRDVSAAILDVIRNNKPERVVPRLYHAAQIPKVLAPRLYRLAQTAVLGRVPR